MDNEQWKVISDFPDYAISNQGRVMRIAKGSNTYPGKILRPGKVRSGYLLVMLSKNKKKYPNPVHKLVAMAFLGPCPKGKEVNHKNGKKINNYLVNLEYLTKSENAKHAFNLGLIKRVKGSEHPKAKLTEKNIFTIIKLREKGLSFHKIATIFNVTNTSIRYIFSGQNWSWLTGIERR